MIKVTRYLQFYTNRCNEAITLLGTLLSGQSQRTSPRPFPCGCRGKSYKVPDNVKDVRLEDIDIIGAIGDSDTAAFAANSRGGIVWVEYPNIYLFISLDILYK